MLRFRYRMRPRRLPQASGRTETGHGTGPQGRIEKMRKLVTAIVRHERIEGHYFYMDEARGYVERLIQISQKYGDCHKKTMEMADYWLLEKDLVHKLFKVLVPRFNNYPGAYTSVWYLPTPTPGLPFKQAILELKGNPWPPVISKERDFSKSLVNVLMEEARREYREEKKHRMDTDNETVMAGHVPKSADNGGQEGVVNDLQDLTLEPNSKEEIMKDGTPV